jgi:hypothetical protein
MYRNPNQTVVPKSATIGMPRPRPTPSAIFVVLFCGSGEGAGDTVLDCVVEDVGEEVGVEDAGVMELEVLAVEILKYVDLNEPSA